MPLRKIFEYARNFWPLEVFLVLGVVLIFIFWYWVAGAHRDFLQKNEELSILAARRANMLQLKREHVGIDMLKKRLEQSFITPDTTVDFIEFIESSGREAGVAATISSVAEDSTGRVFKITADGSYSGLVNFLARLENSAYLAHVVKLEFNKIVKDGSLNSAIDLKLAL